MFEMVEQELMRNRTEELRRQADEYRRARQAQAGSRRRRSGATPKTAEPEAEGRVSRTFRKIGRRSQRGAPRTC
ncbi:hypothetical protein [Streptomyces sp. NPDC047108]|uniref:hypothetical protein n=1 Tax=Streptomyces sp. NPDC047108 TaxID=3155025 RepID=UPI0033CA6D78